MGSPRRLDPLVRAAFAFGLAMALVACGARTGFDADGTADGGVRSPPAELRSCSRAKPVGAVTSFLDFPSARPGAVDRVTSRGLGVVRGGQLAYAYRGLPPSDPGGVFQVTWPNSAGRVSGQTEPLGLVATASLVLWSDTVGLQQFALAGEQSGRQVLVRAGVVTPHIAVDGTFAYALIDGSQEAPGRLLRVDLANGDERVLATLDQDFRGAGLIVDGERVIDAQSALTFLWGLRKDGSDSRPRAVQTVAGAPLAISVQGLAFDGRDLRAAVHDLGDRRLADCRHEPERDPRRRPPHDPRRGDHRWHDHRRLRRHLRRLRGARAPRQRPRRVVDPRTFLPRRCLPRRVGSWRGSCFSHRCRRRAPLFHRRRSARYAHGTSRPHSLAAEVAGRNRHPHDRRVAHVSASGRCAFYDARKTPAFSAAPALHSRRLAMRALPILLAQCLCSIGCFIGTDSDPPAPRPAPIKAESVCVKVGLGATTVDKQGAQVTLDGSRLFYSRGATVASAQLDADCVTVSATFSAGQDSISGIAVANGRLLVATNAELLYRSSDTRLVSYSLTDQRPTAVGFGSFMSAGLATDGEISFLLVRQPIGFEVRRFGDGDRDGNRVDGSDAKAGGVLVDDAWVYWTAGDTLYRQPKTGPETTERFARLPGAPGVNAQSTSGLLAQDDRFLFWQDTFVLLRVAKSSGEVVNLTESVAPAASIAVHGSDVFLAEGGRLTRVPVDGGQPETLATEDGISSVSVSDRYLVWSAAGAVRAMRRR